MADHERDRGPGRPAVQEHVDHRQVLRVIAQLNAPASEGRIDGIGVAVQRDGRNPGHPAGHRPPERLPDQRRVRLPVRPAGLEPVNGRLPGLGMHPPVGDLLGPRREPVVELVQRLDALVRRLGQERKLDQNTTGDEHDGHSGRGTRTARPIDAYASTVSGHGHTMDMANHRLRSLLATGRQTQARRDLHIK